MNLLQTYKRSNKKRRERIASLAGFKGTRSYLKYIQSQPSDISKIRKVSRTEMLKIIEDNSDKEITVNYNKSADPKNIKKALYELYPNREHITSKKDYERAVDKCINLKGPERTIKGEYTGGIDSFGRLGFFEDGDFKLVDSRTLNWIIIDTVKYVRK